MKRFKVLFPLCAAVLAIAAVVVVLPRPAEAIALCAPSAEPEPVFIDIHDFVVSDDTAVGTFDASGAIETSGLESQVFRVSGLSLHCVHTLTAAEGTIVIRSQCNLVTNVGQWRIVSGTGAYAGLKGNGSLLMVFNPDDPAEAHELLDGWVY
ncbi:MAG: hypothetical protein HY000_04220 [Planctomycetes bacterium]|nr:hypothetical protein [Planctomycetota bacterium]